MAVRRFLVNSRTIRASVATLALSLALLTGCGGSGTTGGGSSSCGITCNPATYSASVSSSSLNFTAVAGLGISSSQTVTLTNTGTGTLTVTSIGMSGTSASLFAATGTVVTNPCGTSISLAPNASCNVPVAFITTGSGTFTASLTFTDNATAGNQTVALTGTGLGSATTANTVDCSVNSATCANTFTGGYTTANSQLATDPIAAGLFHGYADPSIRKDPNANVTYYAYSWAKTLSDGTHVVDLHLAESTNLGASFTEVGTLYQSVQTTQTQSTAYSSVDDSSTETVDLIPIPLTGSSAGQTLWVQAHQSYLVAPQGGIYDQLNATNLISVTAVQVATPGTPGATLLGLGTAPEARLGAAGTDASRNITQSLYGLSTSTTKCANWGQPTLWYQSPTLYLALECTEFTGTGQVDGNELAHFLYSTTPTGTDASKWVWAYSGEFATPAQAIKLGATTAENQSYSFFTEPEFVSGKSGQLYVLLTPGVFNTSPTATQPVIQYGCRTVPVTSLSTSGITLDTDATTGAPVVTSKLTENDLYSGVNEGPAACTYDPATVNGIIIGRKFENDPTYGFYLYPVNSNISLTP
jgi:hypothetical protein